MKEKFIQYWDKSRTFGSNPVYGEYDRYNADKFVEFIIRDVCDKLEPEKRKEILEYYGFIVNEDKPFIIPMEENVHWDINLGL